MKNLISLALLLLPRILCLGAPYQNYRAINVKTNIIVFHDSVVKHFLPTEVVNKRIKKLSHKVVIVTKMDHTEIKGLLREVTESSIIISDASNQQTTIEVPYSDINKIRIRRKQGIINSTGIGTGIGLLPLLGGAVIGQVEGAGYVCM